MPVLNPRIKKAALEYAAKNERKKKLEKELLILRELILENVDIGQHILDTKHTLNIRIVVRETLDHDQVRSLLPPGSLQLCVKKVSAKILEVRLI